MTTAAQVRARLRFDVERLRSAAHRLESVDQTLLGLRARLEARAAHLASEAFAAERIADDRRGGERVHLRRSQAQATALLSKRVALGEVLRSSSPVALIASMAVSRFVGAMKASSGRPAGEMLLRSHIEAGRIAHRILGALRPTSGIRSGVGQLTSAVVVAELAHEADALFIEEQIEEGLDRARAASGVRTEEDAIEAASSALRVAAELLDSMADRAEPAALALLREAEGIETRVEEDFELAASGTSDRPHSRK